MILSPSLSFTPCRYPFFASHKKSHTRFGDASAGTVASTFLFYLLFVTDRILFVLDLARAIKDIIKYKANLEGYFDVGTDIVRHTSS